MPHTSETLDFENLENLIKKYSGNTPRYTSYPTAVEFSSEVSSQDWEHALREDRVQRDSGSSLYVHLPFCHSLCYFCACNKKIAQDDSGVAPYLKSLDRELKKYSEIIDSNKPLEQLHWGGGTPNFLSPEASEELFGKCKELFPSFSTDADISVEIDPRVLTQRLLATYKKLGFNRVSLGVQDFNPDVQKAINRIQPYEQTEDACRSARELGFSSINLDLIYGLPLQTEASFQKTIEKVLTLRPERIALYGYAHVTWKKKVQKSLQRHDLPSPQVRLNLFLCALRLLREAGYEYIGMDHFALPEDSLAVAFNSGTLNRNFMGYTTHHGSSVLGVGVSAISSIPSMLAQNASDLDEYSKMSDTDGLATARGIVCSLEDQLRAEIIQGILCRGQIDYQMIEKKWNLKFHSKFPDALAQLEELKADGLVELTQETAKVTELGRLFMRNIACLFDEYLVKHKSKSTFSQSV